MYEYKQVAAAICVPSLSMVRPLLSHCATFDGCVLQESLRAGQSGVPFEAGADEAMAAIYSNVIGTAIRESTVTRRANSVGCLLSELTSAAKDSQKLKVTRKELSHSCEAKIMRAI